MRWPCPLWRAGPLPASLVQSTHPYAAPSCKTSSPPKTAKPAPWSQNREPPMSHENLALEENRGHPIHQRCTLSHVCNPVQTGHFWTAGIRKNHHSQCHRRLSRRGLPGYRPRRVVEITCPAKFTQVLTETRISTIMPTTIRHFARPAPCMKTPSPQEHP